MSFKKVRGPLTTNIQEVVETSICVVKETWRFVLQNMIEEIVPSVVQIEPVTEVDSMNLTSERQRYI